MSIILKSLNFLAIDCQTSGNSPKTGHLLEMGWTVFSADAFGAPESIVPTTHLIRQPPGIVLPARIQKLTGIKTAHLENAVSAQETLEALVMAAENVAQGDQLELCPTVIHYARFEMAFLQQLHKRLKQNRPLPLDVICTHQLASRLFPELPRKGLRAVAGYLGHSVPALKRCNAHIRATAYIWARMVHHLADQKNIHTLDQLHHWLNKPSHSAISKVYPMPRHIRLGVPDAPGIYRMKRSNADVLYIGKAASLKQRVNSYFQKSRRHSENTLEMLTQAVDLDFTTTPTALEAALLESDAIKSCKPPYNIALAGDHRNLFFISRDFSKHSAVYDNSCPYGPVPSIDPYVAAHAVGTYLLCETARQWSICKTMAMPERYCPDEACLKAGLSIFQQRYSGPIEGMSIRQAILHIGRLSWLERLKRKSLPLEESESDTANIEDDGDFVWSPLSVASSLESVCRRCGFFLRRARWFALLSEATVVWKTRNSEDKTRNIIILKGGKASDRVTMDIDAPLPQPFHADGSYPSRRAGMDLEIYDALRVLTTELRRLLAENRFECIQLGRKVTLHPEQLRMVLNWV